MDVDSGHTNTTDWSSSYVSITVILCEFWSIASENSDENDKFKNKIKKNLFNLQESFYARLSWFLTCVKNGYCK